MEPTDQSPPPETAPLLKFRYLLGVASLASASLYACSSTPVGPPVPTVATVLVSPGATTTTSIGETVQLSAVAKENNGTNVQGQTFTWSSSNTAVATVNKSGLVTAVTVGSATISAATAGVSGSAALTAEQVVASVAVTSGANMLNVLGATEQLSAGSFDARGNEVPGTAFSWASSDAAVITVDGTGLVTGVSNGTATITAMTAGVSGALTMNMQQVAGSIVVTPDSSTLNALGDTQQYVAAATDSAGNDISGLSFVWASSDSSVASVDGSGLVSASSNGSATISATSGPASASANVLIDQIPVALTLTPNLDTLVSIGETLQMVAAVRDANDSVIPGNTFGWSTADSTVATVSNTGLVTAIVDGATTITATNGGSSAQAAIEVEQRVDTVIVSSTRDSLIIVGDSSSFGAVATDALSNAMAGKTFVWTTSNGAVATVDAVGKVTAVAGGTATISATTDGVLGSGDLFVNPTVVARLDMPDSADAAGQVMADLVLLTTGTGASTGAFAATLSWDPAVLTFNAGINPSNFASWVADNAAGTLRTVVSDPAGMVGNLLSLTITFDVVGAGGSSTSMAVGIDQLLESGTFADFATGAVSQNHSLSVR